MSSSDWETKSLPPVFFQACLIEFELDFVVLYLLFFSSRGHLPGIGRRVPVVAAEADAALGRQGVVGSDVTGRQLRRRGGVRRRHGGADPPFRPRQQTAQPILQRQQLCVRRRSHWFNVRVQPFANRILRRPWLLRSLRTRLLYNQSLSIWLQVLFRPAHLSPPPPASYANPWPCLSIFHRSTEKQSVLGWK